MAVQLREGATLGRYRLTRPISAGGMGSVWAAEDLSLERQVAVKVLPPLLAADPSAERRFEREARALARLRHPNVVTVFDIGTASGSASAPMPYLVMELLEGESLDRIAARGPLAPALVVEILEQVASALEAAHSEGVVHRDLKPSNVMLGPDDHVTVLDFGLARFLQRTGRPADDTLTTPGMVLGSCAYMAPEQARGDGVTPASDVFAVGAVAYELLAGRRAFDGPTPLQVLQEVVRCEPAPLVEVAPDVPTELARIVERCLERDPARRYPSCAELAEAIRGLELPRPARSGTPLPEPSPPRPAGRGLAIAGLVAAAVAAGALAGWLGSRHASPPAEAWEVRELDVPPGLLSAPTWDPRGGSLLVVHAAGGRSQLLAVGTDAATASPVVRGAIGEELASPSVSPDGRLVLLEFRRASDHGRSLRVLPLAGGPPAAVIEDAAGGAWVGARDIAFVRPSDATVQLSRLGEPGTRPLDLTGLGGPVARLAGGPDGRLAAVVAGPAWSVARWSDAGGPPRTWYQAAGPVWDCDLRGDRDAALVVDGNRLVEIDAGGAARGWTAIPGLRDIAVSPDGTRVAAVVTASWLELVEASPGAEAPRTLSEAIPPGPGIAVASDGTVAFATASDGRVRWWLRPPDGLDRRISCGAGRVVHVVPETGGRRAACVVRPEGGGVELRISITATGSATTVADEIDATAVPAWSPDGSRLAVVRGDPAGIELVDTGGGGSTRVFDATALALDFRPGGGWLLARVGDRSDGEKPGVWAIPTESGGWPRHLTDRPGPVAWVPDGSAVWQLRPTSDGPELWRSALDGPWRPARPAGGWWPSEAALDRAILPSRLGGAGLLVLRPVGADRMVLVARGAVLD